jgi:hypothetical protein
MEPRLGHDSFHPNPFQLIVYQSSYLPFDAVV